MMSCAVFCAICWVLLGACAPSSGHFSQADVARYDEAYGNRLDLSLGQQYISLLPVSRIFVDDSANFLPDAATVLPDIASLIARQAPHWVSITVVDQHADRQVSALSAAQADALVRYFSAQPLGARMVYATPPRSADDPGARPGIHFFSGVSRDLAYIEINYGGVAG
jgi:hypothetical protein